MTAPSVFTAQVYQDPALTEAKEPAVVAWVLRSLYSPVIMEVSKVSILSPLDCRSKSLPQHTTERSVFNPQVLNCPM